MDDLREKRVIPVFRPELPRAEAISPYLQRIDATGLYSNMGPLVREFERRLGAHFGVPADQVITCVNGTIGLTIALWAMGVPPGSYCAMPSWTFVATAASAHAAGLKPLFLDVDRASWALSPETVESVTNEFNVRSVVPVAPFGAPINLKAWEAFQDRTGIPVIIDAAAAFDSFSARRLPASKLPFMISFHATKSLAMGEGAAIVTHDASFAKELRKLTNFGFLGSRVATNTGINAKISEYTAAIGLASLDEWPDRRSRWEHLTNAFLAKTGMRNELSVAPGMGEDWVSVYGNVELASRYNSASVMAALQGRGIEARSWWGEGTHRHPAYDALPQINLENTNYLGSHVVGLPFWLGIDETKLDAVFAALNEVLSES